MSSANPGRYQSQLFNFLNRQTQKLSDRTGRAMRNLKVAAVWGVQILLYPVYLGVQAARLIGHQIQQAVQQVSPQLQTSQSSQPPTVDTPIQRVLQAVDTLPQLEAYQEGELVSLALSPGKPELVERLTVNFSGLNSKENSSLEEIPTALRPQKRIQGVATLLETRTLVLVTLDNQILDILTPQQQQQLASRISWEMADYNRGRNRLQSSRFTKSLVTTAKQQQLFLPIRIFWQVMSWVQQGQVAIAANLFGESTLLMSPQTVGISTTTVLQKDFIWQHLLPLSKDTTKLSPSKEKRISQSLAFLDRTVASIDRPLTTATETATRTLQKYQQGWITFRGSLTNADPNEADRQGIQALIRAAIDYFFGKRSPEFPENSSQETIVGTQSDRLPPGCPEELDPWLTWDDLYREPTLITSVPLAEPQLHLPGSHQPQPKNSFWGAIKRRLNVQSTALQYSPPVPSDLVIQEPITTSIKPPKTHPSRKRPPQRRKAASQREQSHAAITVPVPVSESYLDPAPEWIETQATPMGYVKHPLEQLLEWLDRAMLWLEELFVKIWRFLFQR